MLLILHADHEQNCSTSTVRLVGSSRANLYASIAAGISALWGPLHGGANQAVIEMLEAIAAEGGNVDRFVARAKDKNDTTRLMGFGHRIYKNYDPRAAILKKACADVLATMGGSSQLLEIAMRLEEIALSDEYFISHKLYPNVDFYSGVIYRAIGIPTNMFTVMFAIGRLPGWVAQWLEARARRRLPHRPPAPDLHRRHQTLRSVKKGTGPFFPLREKGACPLFYCPLFFTVTGTPFRKLMPESGSITRRSMSTLQFAPGFADAVVPNAGLVTPAMRHAHDAGHQLVTDDRGDLDLTDVARQRYPLAGGDAQAFRVRRVHA